MQETKYEGPMFVHLIWWYWLIMFVSIPVTLGVGTIGMWWVARYRFPKVIDDEGIVKRNGKKLLWRDLTRCQKTTLVNKHGKRVSGSVDLYFGDEVVKINPYAFAEGFEVLKFVRMVSGQEIDIG